MASSTPPLNGLRVVELAGLAPAPFAGLILADYGASVLRIDRPPLPSEPTVDLLTRHKSSLVLDLKSPSSLSILEAILKKADVLIDSYRPGVLESLGLHHEKLLQQNPRLIVARLTGFRRAGPYAQMAGHDINYLAVSGVLSQLGRSDQPPYPPANILADFAGGGLMCAMGILLALVNRGKTGRGQVIDAHMVDGSAYLGTFLRLLRRTPVGDQPRAKNVLDGGCPWYDVYECKEGGYMAVGALEEKFFKELIRRLGFNESWTERRWDRDTWPELRILMRNAFLKKTRKEWEDIFIGTDACCTPVLEQQELQDSGYEQRPAVGLSESPAPEVQDRREGKGLAPGTGGERMMCDWLNWKRGRDYTDKHRGFHLIESAKL